MEVTPIRVQTIALKKNQSVITSLVFTMKDLIHCREADKPLPPFKLVIIDNRGCVVFRGEVSGNGTLRRLSPFPKLRPSHFPANAFLTDRSLRVRTFQIEFDPTTAPTAQRFE
jgi:hypothetical protein